MSIVPFRTSCAPAYRRSGFEQFDRLFDGLFRNALTNISAPGPSLSDLAVRMDISETDKAYVIKADMPGIDEKDVALTLDDGILSLSAERKSETEDEGRTWHRVERSYGSFRRSLALPADADENGVTAQMKNGVLEITVAKRAEVEKASRRIEIKS